MPSSSPSFSTDTGDSALISDSSYEDLESLRTPFADHNDGAHIVESSTSNLDYFRKAKPDFIQHSLSDESIVSYSTRDVEAVDDLFAPETPFRKHAGFDSDAFLALASPSATSRSLTSTTISDSFEIDPFSASFLSDLDKKDTSLSSLGCDSFEQIYTSQDFCEKSRTTPDNVSNRDCTERMSYYPLTLGKAYSYRFPSGHHLEVDFVRSYTLSAELGCGGYGFVMAAHDIYNNKEVAVKFIFKEKIPDHAWAVDDLGKPVPLEAKLLSFVHHDGIVKFYDLFEDNLYFYLVHELHGSPWCAGLESGPIEDTSPAFPRAVDLESSNGCSTTITPSSLMLDNICNKSHSSEDSLRSGKENIAPKLSDGIKKFRSQAGTTKSTCFSRPDIARRPSRDLFECIEQSRGRRLSEEDAKYIFAQVVNIVEYLDGLGIIHRDIKDENLLIDQDRKVKLIDFGSVVVEDRKELRPYYTVFFGTAAYAASEILRKKPYQAAPAEVWTLGVLLSYLLTGSSPFPTERHAVEGRIILDCPSAKLFSKACLHLLTRCLEADPEKRADIKEIKSHIWLQNAS